MQCKISRFDKKTRRSEGRTARSAEGERFASLNEKANLHCVIARSRSDRGNLCVSGVMLVYYYDEVSDEDRDRLPRLLRSLAMTQEGAKLPQSASLTTPSRGSQRSAAEWKSTPRRLRHYASWTHYISRQISPFAPSLMIFVSASLSL